MAYYFSEKTTNLLLKVNVNKVMSMTFESISKQMVSKYFYFLDTIAIYEIFKCTFYAYMVQHIYIYMVTGSYRYKCKLTH